MAMAVPIANWMMTVTACSTTLTSVEHDAGGFDGRWQHCADSQLDDDGDGVTNTLMCVRTRRRVIRQCLWLARVSWTMTVTACSTTLTSVRTRRRGIRLTPAVAAPASFLQDSDGDGVYDGVDQCPNTVADLM